MKKLLAILLALLLPLAAAADSDGICITVETEEAAFLQFAKALLMLDPAMDAATAAQDAALFQKLLDGLALDMTVQDNAAEMELRIGEQRLIDMTVYDDGQGTYLTSSMLPGYALKTTAAAPAADAAALDQIDWAGALQSAYPAAEAWLSSLEAQESRGVFIGDAYEGGVKCKTWTITDMDIAALVAAVMTEDVRTAVETLLSANGLDGKALIQQLDELNDKVAEDNSTVYILRAVTDGQDGLVGLSLAVVQNDVQVATASLGTEDASVRLVIGLGLQQENYWGEWTFTPVYDADAAWALKGTVREWSGSKDEAFASVSAEKEPVLAHDWLFRLHEAEDAYACEFEIGFRGETALRINLSVSPAEDIPTMDANLQICDTDDSGDQELHQKLLNQFSAALMARLIKVLPLQTIHEMNPFTLP